MGFLLQDKVKVPVSGQDTPDLALPDICGVADEEEARWLYHFQLFVSDVGRARSVTPFDGRLLFGMVCSGLTHRESRHRSASILPYRFRQDMRAARAFTGHLVGYQDAPMWRKYSPGYRSLWPIAPCSMTEIEVPFRLWSSTPISVKAYGLLLARNPYCEHLRESNPIAWATWCATHTLMVQSTAASLLDECRHHDRLFWLNPKLTTIMKQIGFDQIAGIGPGHGEIIRTPVLSIGRVRWNLVDPIGTTVPKHSAHGTPVFVSGDAVSWASNRGMAGELSLIPQMIHVGDRPVDRGTPIVGNLESRGRREPDNGYGLRLPGWDGYSVRTMRVGSISPWEEEAARRYTEYCARQDSRFQRDHEQHLGRLKETNQRQRTRIGFERVRAGPPPLVHDTHRPVNEQYHLSNKGGCNVLPVGHGHQRAPVSRRHHTRHVDAEGLGIASHARKRHIGSVVSDEGIERPRKRISSSNDVFDGARIPGREELNRLLSLLTPVQRSRHTDMVKAASLRALEAMKEYLSKDCSGKGDAEGQVPDAPENQS